MILAIDTSTLVGSVAIAGDDGEVVAEACERVTTHSEKLLPLVERVLAAAGARIGDVTAVACGAGPGSFTGLRIGMATAKGLCWATGRPLVLVSSLAALALNAPPGEALLVPLIDARKGEVFAGFFRLGENLPPVAVRAAIALAPARLRDTLGADADGACLLGDGAIAYRDALAGLRILGGPHEVRAAKVARLARARLARGEHDDLASAAPTYVRASDAEQARAKALRGAS